jgi:three-Cys-motif partner protein
MVQKVYTWESGAKLEPHTQRKHKILAEYFRQYIRVRCGNPNQRRFRLAVVDGFAGGGRYACGTRGSPLIFIEELRAAIDEININRASQRMPLLVVDCLLLLNDADPKVIKFLQSNVSPVLAEARLGCPQLQLTVDYTDIPFENAYPSMREKIRAGGYQNVLFNLDQCGHSHVDPKTLIDIMSGAPSAEIFFTFVVDALLTYLHKKDPAKLKRQLEGVGVTNIEALEEVQSNPVWLGTAEKLVFGTLQGCAKFVSPFSIHNPKGWRYWLIHLAGNHRARQVYNDVLHANASSQAHFGRSGLNMLSYNPDKEGVLYLFEQDDRIAAREELMNDIPSVIARAGDTMGVMEFYETVYNLTPAHNGDINSAIIDNPDLEVMTETGGGRRHAHTIHVTDTIRLKSQTSFPFLLPRRE